MLILHVLGILACTTGTHYEVPIDVIFEDAAFQKAVGELLRNRDLPHEYNDSMEYSVGENLIEEVLESVENYVNALLFDLEVSVLLSFVYEDTNRVSQQVCANPYRMHGILKQLPAYKNTIYVAGCADQPQERARTDFPEGHVKGAELSVYTNTRDRPGNKTMLSTSFNSFSVLKRHKMSPYEFRKAAQMRDMAIMNSIRLQGEKRKPMPFRKQYTTNASRCVILSGVYLDEHYVYNLRKAVMEIVGGRAVRANVDADIRRGICEYVRSCYEGEVLEEMW